MKANGITGAVNCVLVNEFSLKKTGYCPMPILFPAIDLKQGECVRLRKGKMEEATVFNASPGEQARIFDNQGFTWLHVVDLDGAFAGESRNAAAIESILSSTGSSVQLGGGIRTLDQIGIWLEKGVKRVILGTIAVQNPEFVKDACKNFHGRIAVGIDARAGKVAIQGWAEESELSDVELAKRFEDAGVSAIIHTDIDRDGVLSGLNFDSTLKLAESIGIPVIISGGLAGIEDIKRLLNPDCAILEGAVSGRALYDGRLDAEEAIALIRKYEET